MLVVADSELLFHLKLDFLVGETVYLPDKELFQNRLVRKGLVDEVF